MAITLLEEMHKFKRLVTDPIDATGSNDSDIIQVGDMWHCSIQVINDGDVDAVQWELQASQDGGVSWDSVEDSQKTNTGANASNTIVVFPSPGGLLRVHITLAASAGTITVYYSGRQVR